MTERQTDSPSTPTVSESPAGKRNHVLIGGTGRAGTSFLVRYLAGLGLETTLSRHGEGAAWDEQANAGLEEGPDPSSWPYVVKTPWLYQFVDQLLTADTVRLDAVIIPMRPLHQAAASRAILELRSMHQASPWMVHGERPWTEYGTTPGGCLMTLEPLDQARILTAGFYRLIERLVRSDVRVILLAFPRLVEDPDYLFSRLAPLLPNVAVEQARATHARLADVAKVRVGDELAGRISAEAAGSAPAHPDLATLNNIALRREAIRRREELAAAAGTLAQSAAEAAQLREDMETDRARLATVTTDLVGKDRQLAQLEKEIAALGTHNADLIRDRQRSESEVQAIRTALSTAIDSHSRQVSQLRNELALATAARHAMLASTSWHLTGPLRYIGGRIPQTARTRLASAFKLVLRPRFLQY
jgi:hypothetical protein